jgi:cytochrome c-type biogenesis protein
MIEAELAYAFTAGMIAAVNPCGFAMLPAYLSYFLGLEGAEAGHTTSVPRALAVAGVVTAGFILVFGIIGLGITHLGVSIFGQLPWITMLIGLALIGLGLAMAVGGFQLNLRLPKVHTGTIGGDLLSMFVFGVSYAVASLSCTLPVFLPLMTRTFRSANLASGVSVFVMYAAGMGVLLAAITVAIAGARTAMVSRLRAAVPYVNRVAGVVIVLAGAYLAYYGWWERGVLTGDPLDRPPDGPVSFVTSLSSSISNWVGDVGAVRIGLVLGAVVVIALLAVVGLRKPSPKEPTPTG